MPLSTEPRLSRRFSTTVAGGANDQLTYEVQEPATIEQVEVRFYRGPQLDLELVPFIIPGGAEGSGRDDPIPLVQVEGRESLVGDDDKFSFPVAESVEEGDVIGVEYVNTEPEHSYDFHVDMTLERAGGMRRLIPGFLEGVF